MSEHKWVVEPMESYLKHPALSSSGIKLLNYKTPAHFKYYCLEANDVETTDALRWGTIMHKAILEKDDFFARVKVAPCDDKRKKEYRAFAAECAADDIILKESEAEKLNRTVQSISSHEKASRAIKNGIAEVSFYHDLDGIPCKIRPDYIRETDGLIVDLKFVKDADEKNFKKAVWNYSWHIQAAWYLFIFEKVYGFKPKGFLWIAVEKDGPLCTATHIADEGMIEFGLKQCERGIAIFRQCLERDKFPGYEGLNLLSLPHYAWNSEEFEAAYD